MLDELFDVVGHLLPARMWLGLLAVGLTVVGCFLGWTGAAVCWLAAAWLFWLICAGGD